MFDAYILQVTAQAENSTQGEFGPPILVDLPNANDDQSAFQEAVKKITEMNKGKVQGKDRYFHAHRILKVVAYGHQID